jgi:hypothetical protein
MLDANIAAEKDLLALPHLNATMVKGMIGFTDVVSRGESVYEAYADAAAEILHRVFFFGPAMAEHFFTGKAAPEPCSGCFRGMKDPQQGAKKG